MTMNVVRLHRVRKGNRRRSWMPRLGRRLTDLLLVPLRMTSQERAGLYVSRMPTAVLKTPSPAASGRAPGPSGATVCEFPR